MTVTIHPAPTFGQLPDPAPGGRGRLATWQRTIDTLRANPGQWAEIATLKSSGSIGRRGTELRRQGIELAQRNNGDGTATLWGRYVGREQAEASVQQRTSYRATGGTHVLHTFDFRRPDMPPPLVWAPPTEVHA